MGREWAGLPCLADLAEDGIGRLLMDEILLLMMDLERVLMGWVRLEENGWENIVREI